MKNKTRSKIAFYSIVFGWLIFMFVCTSGIWLQGEYRVIVLLFGICFCLLCTTMIRPFLKELEEEKLRYYEATQRLVKKIKEL